MTLSAFYDLERPLGSIRRALNLTQDQMAGELGISLRQYQHFERPDKPIPKSIKLAAAALIIFKTGNLSKTPSA